MKRISLYFLFACLSCTNTPPTVWNEFHGNIGNSGFTNFPAQIANKLKWQFPVGDVAFSSPVADNDGSIYVGNSTGDLFAIKPDGSQKWKQHLVGRLSSPAIGASGNIYITNIQRITDSNHTSSLFSLDKDGHSLRNWWYAFPDHGYTTAPPKVFSTGKDEFIFVPAHTDNGAELFTFINQEGAVFMSRSRANCIPNEIVNEGIKNPFEFHIQGIQFDPIFSNEDPPVAISTKGDGGERNPVIVYAAKNCHLMGFTLDPVQHTMTQIWISPYDYRFYPAPAITTGGVIILGHGDKTISAYNVTDGKKFWDFEEQNPLDDINGFYDCPAILLGSSPSYHLFYNRIVAVDDKGNQVNKFETDQRDNGTDASPLVTTKFVYAAFPSGLYTLNLNLERLWEIPFLPGPNTTILSSPIAGPDGTIYMVDANGILEAFGFDPNLKSGNQSLHR